MAPTPLIRNGVHHLSSASHRDYLPNVSTAALIVSISYHICHVRTIDPSSPLISLPSDEFISQLLSGSNARPYSLLQQCEILSLSRSSQPGASFHVVGYYSGGVFYGDANETKTAKGRAIFVICE